MIVMMEIILTMTNHHINHINQKNHSLRQVISFSCFQRNANEMISAFGG